MYCHLSNGVVWATVLFRQRCYWGQRCYLAQRCYWTYLGMRTVSMM